MASRSDLTILGGGLAGLSLALQCRQKLPKASITVLEKRKHPVPEAAHKVGESSVEVGAHYFGRVLGLRQHILEEQLPKLGLRFFFPADDNSRIEERLELGGRRYAPCPSYQLDRGRFENYLADRCLQQGVQFIDQANVTDVTIGRWGQRHQVSFEVNGEQHQTLSRWVVDASGRRALLKRQFGLEKSSPHLANAAWFRFSQHIKIDEWCADETWQQGYEGKIARWYSTNHLMGKGYWVWMIPLSSGSTSMGIVAAEEFHSLSDFNSIDKAVVWLEKHEPQCADAVKDHLDKLQDFRAIKHYATECTQVFSRHRWGITGEAGFFHDPFYSPGSDFIAFANTFLSDLIHRDMTWKGFRIRARVYDRIYKRFYYGTKTVYQDQYQIFGNPTVMPVKILWDYLVYWYITGYFFMHDRMCEQTTYLRHLSLLAEYEKVNHFMQQFFQTWHQATDGTDARGEVDISQVKLVRESNRRLLDELTTKEFSQRFQSNLRQLETLACEIVEHSGIKMDVPFQRSKEPDVWRNTFEAVLNPRNRSRSSQEIIAAAGTSP